MHALDTVVFIPSVTLRMMRNGRICIYPFHYRKVVILKKRPSTGVLNATNERPNDIHGHTVSGHDVRNSSNSLLYGSRVLSSEVEKLMWFC